LLPEFCTEYRSEALKALCLKRSWSDFDPQAYYPYGEDQNHETSFKDKALQAAVDSWCKIQVVILGVSGNLKIQISNIETNSNKQNTNYQNGRLTVPARPCFEF